MRAWDILAVLFTVAVTGYLLWGCSTVDLTRTYYDDAGNVERVDELKIVRPWGTSHNALKVTPAGTIEARAEGEGMSDNMAATLPAVAEGAARGAASGAAPGP